MQRTMSREPVGILLVSERLRSGRNSARPHRSRRRCIEVARQGRLAQVRTPSRRVALTSRQAPGDAARARRTARPLPGKVASHTRLVDRARPVLIQSRSTSFRPPLVCSGSWLTSTRDRFRPRSIAPAKVSDSHSPRSRATDGDTDASQSLSIAAVRLTNASDSLSITTDNTTNASDSLSIATDSGTDASGVALDRD
jgi:hypothetical protein